MDPTKVFGLSQQDVQYLQAAFFLAGPEESFSGWEPRKRQSGRGEEWGASCLACGLSALGKKVKL